MNKKTLLLNSNYQFVSFIDIKRAIKHIIKDKVEVINTWGSVITYGNGEIQHPAIVKLKEPFKRSYVSVTFSRTAIIRRDQNHCQYCNKILRGFDLTIDHIIPRAHGGQSNFSNCVVACRACNSKKANRTPEQAEMILLKIPQYPSPCFLNYVVNHEPWHSDWNTFISKVE